MKYFFVCGESSGDYLSSIVAKELIEAHGAEIKAMGGSFLASAGAKIIQNIDETKVMGWLDVLSKLGQFKRILVKLKQAILDYEPDAVILVDFGSFNLRLAEWCFKKEIRVIYFAPPKVWASREGRLEKLRKYCDKVIVLFPFEKEYFDARGLPTEYYGYPLANIRNNTTKDPNFRSQFELLDQPIISVLPGSREQEIKYMLAPMLQAASRIEGYQICISQAKGIQSEILEKYIPTGLKARVKIIKGTPYQLLVQSEFAIVTSGTATIECALLNVPMIVCYKTALLNYAIAKQIIKVPFISLPNLILSQNVVPELIQGSCNTKDIYEALRSAFEPSQLSSQRAHFSKIYDKLYNLNTISSIAKAINNRG